MRKISASILTLVAIATLTGCSAQIVQPNHAAYLPAVHKVAGTGSDQAVFDDLYVKEAVQECHLFKVGGTYADLLSTFEGSDVGAKLESILIHEGVKDYCPQYLTKIN